MEDSFIDTVLDIHHGELAEDINREFESLIRTVKARGGSGSIQVTLKLNRVSEHKLDVNGSVSSTIPKKKYGSALYYANEHNQLQKNDPNQRRLFEETRSVDDEEGVRSV